MKKALFVWLCCCLFSCTRVQAGSFTIDFTWLEKPAQTQGLFAYAEVLGVTDGGQSVTLASSGPLPLESHLELNFNEVANGANRLVRVEIRATPLLDSPVLYYGISHFFNLSADTETLVRVRVPLQSVPEISEQTLSVAHFTSTPHVQLVLTHKKAVYAKIANTLAGIDAAEPLFFKEKLQTAWDLNTQAPLCLAMPCQRQVFARVFDNEGYGSRVFSTTLLLDTEAPVVLPNSIRFEPTVLNPQSLFLVRFVTSENVVAEDVYLSVEFNGKVVDSEFIQQHNDNAFLFVANAPIFSSDGVYRVFANHLRDEADNFTEQIFLGEVYFDSVAPRVVELQANPLKASKVEGFRTVSVDFRIENEFSSVNVFLNHFMLDCNVIADVFHCEHQVGEFDSEGMMLIRVVASDAALNTTTQQTFVEFDFTKPSVHANSLTLLLRPDAGNLLRQVSQVTFGTQVHIQLLATESLSNVLTASLVREDNAPFEMLWQHFNNNSIDLGFSLFSEPLDGFYDLQLELVDDVGNAQTIILPELVFVKTALPAVMRTACVNYTRAPYGSLLTEHVPRFWVEGCSESAEPLHTVIIFDENLDEIKRTVALNDGSFLDIELPRLDREKIFVANVDAAGNVSPAVAVEHNTWIAALNSELQPHQFFMGSWFENIEQPVISPVVSSVALLFNDNLYLESAHADDWLLHPMVSPIPQANPLMTYDSGRQRFVMLTRNTISEWDGKNWFIFSVALEKAEGVFAYDRFRQRSVFYSGNEVWEWDGKNFSLINSTDLPLPRSFAAFAYDDFSQQLILFGGENFNNEMFDDLWAYNGDSWQELCIGCIEKPSPRRDAAVFYDSATYSLIIFGGIDANGNVLNDTWVFNGFEFQELLIDGPLLQSKPKIVLNNNGIGWIADVYKKETWQFKNSNWKKSTVDFIALSEPETYQITYKDDSWVWFGPHLIQITANGAISFDDLGYSPPPSPRSASMLYNQKNESLMLVYGNGNFTNTNNDLWLYQNAQWQNLSSTPSRRRNAVWLYDTTKQQAVLFGGESPTLRLYGDLWTWDSTWKSIPQTNPPQARGSAAATYDTHQQAMIVFGGNNEFQLLNDTWYYQNNQWLFLATNTSPSPRRNASMCYDTAQQQTWLFGGLSVSGENNDLWILKNNQWQEIITEQKPEARTEQQLAYLPTENALLLFGGKKNDDTMYFNDTWLLRKTTQSANQEWQWQHNQLTDITGDGSPSARAQAGITYDNKSDSVWLFGGYRNNEYFNDLWQWRSGKNQNVWQQFEVDLKTIQSTFKQITIVWKTTQPVELLVWDRNTWLSLGTQQNGLWQMTNPKQLQRLRKQPTLRFTIIANTIASDYVEVQIKY